MPTFDAGSIRAEADLDRRPFMTALRDLQREGDRFAAKKFTATAALDDRDVNTRLAQIRRNLDTLGDANIDVNVSGNSSTSLREIDRLADRLDNRRINMRIELAGSSAVVSELSRIDALADRLDGRRIGTRVDVDGAAEATTQVAGLNGELSRLDGRSASASASVRTLGSSAGSAGGGMLNLVAAALALGPALIPIAAGALAAGGALAALGATAGAGIGLFTGATIGAIKATIDNKKAVDTTTQALQSAQSAYAGTASGVSSAANAIKSAQTAYTDALRGRTQAMQQVQDAEHNLANAQQASRDAQKDLTDARNDATRSLKDLNLQLSGNKLDEESAKLRVERAKEELDAINNNTKASKLDRQEKDLAYREALQQLAETKNKNSEFAADADKQFKAGVEGNDKVVAAKKRVNQAQDQEAQAARQVTQAQVGVSRANEQVAAAARGITQAQQQMVQAQRTAAQAAAALAAAQDKHNAAVKAFSPVEKAFSASLDRMSAGWKRFISDTETTTLPIAAKVVDSITAGFDKAAPVVRAFGPVFNELADATKRWVTGSGLDRFFQMVTTYGVPATRNLGAGFRSLLGVGGDLLRAFAPLGVTLSRMFADWAARLNNWSSGGGFERFINYVKANAPQLKAFFSSLKDALGQLTVAFRGLGGPSLLLSTILLKLIAHTPVPVLRLMIVAFVAWRVAVMAATVAANLHNAAITLGIISTGRWTAATVLSSVASKAAAAATTLWTAALRVLRLAMVSTGVGAIVVAIGLAITAIVLIATKTTWFQTAWKYSWNAIKQVTSDVWNFLRDKIFNPIVDFFTNKIPGAANWLWTHVRDRWQQMSDKIAGIFAWLRDHVWSPIVNYFSKSIPEAANIMWTKVRDRWQQVSDKLAGIYSWLWNHVLHPIADFFSKTIPNAANTFWTKTRDRWQQTSDKVASIYYWIKDHIFWPMIKFFTDTIPGAANKFANAMKNAFNNAKKWVGDVWKGIKKIVADPINFVINKVYTGGIKNLWDHVADVVFGKGKKHLPNIPSIGGYAEGGAIPGNVPGAVPGKDSVRAWLMPDEHVLTTADVAAMGGQSNVYAFRKALHNGAQPQKAAAGQTAFSIGGDVQPGVPATKPTQVKGGGNNTGNTGMPGEKPSGGGNSTTGGNPGRSYSESQSNLASTDPGVSVFGLIKKLERGAMEAALSPLFKKARSLVSTGIGGAINAAGGSKSSGYGELAIKIGTTPIDWIENFVKDDDSKSAGGANVAAAQAWAKKQVGSPYQWGGGMDPSWDCSGFMASIQKVILGQDPHGRLWSTFDFQGDHAPNGWQHNLKAPFMIGITNEGPGHTAGTLGGLNVECRGGDGVVVGPKARGFDNAMFTDHYGFKPSIGGGGGVIPKGNQKNIIDQALAAAGVPPPGSKEAWERGLNTLITRESNWNAGVTNNWDSNAAAGMASTGLAQVIPPTFAAYHVAGTSNNINDPVANVAAAIRYIVATYGGIENVQQANASLPPKGYATGSLWASSGPAMVAENGAELVTSPSVRNFRGGERVYTAKQTRAMMGGGTTVIMPDSMVVRIGEQEFTAYLDGETRQTIETVFDEANRGY